VRKQIAMEPSVPVSIAVLHPRALVRQSLVSLLKDLPGYQLQTHVSSVPELKRAVATGKVPQVLVLGLCCAEDEGAQLFPWCIGQLPQCRMLVLGCEPPSPVLASLLTAGVHGFFCERNGVERLGQVLDHLCAGALYYPERLFEGLRASMPALRKPVRLHIPLSKRQHEFLCWVAHLDCLDYKAIAERMGVTRNCVLKYRRVLGARYALPTRQALVQFARELGVVK
jgi:DNA-binding NarL/FixJ family response regulator